jgi:hypothetical protein
MNEIGATRASHRHEVGEGFVEVIAVRELA